MDKPQRSSSFDTLIPRSSIEAEYHDKAVFFNQAASKQQRRLQCGLLILLGLSLVANIGLSIVVYDAVFETLNLIRKGDTICKPHTKLYSPAQDTLEYKLTSYASSIYGGETPYQGPPTPENNALWKNLYSHMNTHITYEEAKLLPNKTAPEKEYPGSGYPIVLNVFHDLHCIDSARQVIYYFLDEKWNATYNPYTLYKTPNDALWDFGGRDMGIVHVDHCIDALRQSAQCNVDITPNVFQWSEKAGMVRARATVVHECRNFEKVKQWAIDHHSRMPFVGFGDGPEIGKCAYEDPWTCLYDGEL